MKTKILFRLPLEYPNFNLTKSKRKKEGRGTEVHRQKRCPHKEAEQYIPLTPVHLPCPLPYPVVPNNEIKEEVTS